VVSKVLILELLGRIFNERFLKNENVDKIKTLKNVKNVFYIYMSRATSPDGTSHGAHTSMVRHSTKLDVAPSSCR